MMIKGRNQHNIVKQLSSNWKYINWNKNKSFKRFCIAKETISKQTNKKQSTKWEKMFVNDITDKRFRSVQFSRSVMSDSLRPHGLQHARLLCPSPTLGAYSIHVHWVGDAIQTSHPLSSPSPPIFNFSQLQGLFQWVSSWHQEAKVLELQLQHQSFQLIFRTDFI